MASETNTDIEDAEEPSEEEIEEADEEAEDDDEEEREDSFSNNMELQEDYGAPAVEEKHNPHFIINKVLEKPDTTRATYLTESELGRPLFSVRFLSDLHDDALRLGLTRIERYYWEKIQNITGTGMSNKGFMMNLNVTQRRDQTRRRIKDVPKQGDIKK